jgi:hypothetical protein
VPFLDLTSRVLWQLTWRRRLCVKRRRQPKSLQHLDFGIWIAGPQTVGNRRRLDRDLNHGSRNGWKLTSLLQHVEWDLNLGVHQGLVIDATVTTPQFRDLNRWSPNWLHSTVIQHLNSGISIVGPQMVGT